MDSVSLDGEKLYLKGSVPSEVIANRVWDVIKQVDPQYSDLHHEIATTGGPNQSYSVKSGDNLSKISNRFYGSPNHYSNIAAASNISDPNKIQVGQQITYPAYLQPQPNAGCVLLRPEWHIGRHDVSGYFARFCGFPHPHSFPSRLFLSGFPPSKPPFREFSSRAQEKSTLSCPEMPGGRAKISLSTLLQSMIYKLT